MLIAERIHVLSDKVGVLTNKAYSMAPTLVSDLHSVSGDLRDLWEAVSEIEPSREDLKLVEARLYRYPSLVSLLTKGKPEWWDKAFWIDNPSHNPRDDVRVQGGASIELAQRIAEARDDLERDVDGSLKDALAEVADIEQAMCRLPRKLEQIIRLRYFDGMCWYDIAEDVGYSRIHCNRMRDEALTLLSIALEK